MPIFQYPLPKEIIPLNNVHLPPPFPVDCLPPVLRDYVNFVSQTVQVYPDMPASLVLSVLSVCLQGKAKVRFSPFWAENINLYVMIAAPPGERKSSVFCLLTSPVNEYVSEYNTQHLSEICEYRNKKRVLEIKLRNAVEGAESQDIINSCQDDLNSLDPCRELKLITTDTTPEALAAAMADNNGKMGILSPEGGIFDVLSGMYSGNTANLNILLSGYDGEAVRIERKYGSVYLPGPLLTFGICTQPKVLNSVITNPQFIGKGLTQRFLFCMPESMIGRRELIEDYIGYDKISKSYHDLIFRLLEFPNNASREIELTVGAADTIKDFSRKLEIQMQDKAVLSDYTEFFGKLPGKALRIAGLLHIAEKGLSDCIGMETMNAAVEIASYFGKHYLKIMCADNYDDTPKQLLDRILAKADRESINVISLRDVKRSHRTLTEEQVTDALDILTARNYLTMIPPNRAGRKKESYAINPSLLRQ